MNIQETFAVAQPDGSLGWEHVNAFITQADEEGILHNSTAGVNEEDMGSSGGVESDINVNSNLVEAPKLYSTPVASTSQEQNSLYRDCVLAISQHGTCDMPDALKPANAEPHRLADLENKFLPNSTFEISPNLRSDNASTSNTPTRRLLSSNSRTCNTSGTPNNNCTPNKSTKKQFKCTEPNCGKVFERRYNLKVHTRRHTGETPYHCMKLDEGCMAQFRWRSSLRHHMKTVHNDVGGPIMKLTPAQHSELLASVLPPSAGLHMLSATRPIAPARRLDLAFASAMTAPPITASGDGCGDGKRGELSKACLSPVTETPPHRGCEVEKVKNGTTEDEYVQPALQYISRDADDDVQFASPLSVLVLPCDDDDEGEDDGGLADGLFDGPGRNGEQDADGGWDNVDIGKVWESPVRSRCSNAVPVLDKEFY